MFWKFLLMDCHISRYRCVFDDNFKWTFSLRFLLLLFECFHHRWLESLNIIVDMESSLLSDLQVMFINLPIEEQLLGLEWPVYLLGLRLLVLPRQLEVDLGHLGYLRYKLEIISCCGRTVMQDLYHFDLFLLLADLGDALVKWRVLRGWLWREFL